MKFEPSPRKGSTPVTSDQSRRSVSTLYKAARIRLRHVGSWRNRLRGVERRQAKKKPRPEDETPTTPGAENRQAKKKSRPCLAQTEDETPTTPGAERRQARPCLAWTEDETPTTPLGAYSYVANLGLESLR